MNLTELESQLEQLERVNQSWSEPIKQAAANFSRVFRDEVYSFEDWTRAVDKAIQEQRAQYDLYKDFESLVDQFCSFYLMATPQQRLEIRNLVDKGVGFLGALFRYAYVSADQLRATRDPEWLRKGLAAISIENFRADDRDDLLALKALYLAAEDVAIDPLPYFQEVAKLSSDEKPRGGSTPVSQVLATFHTYAVLGKRARKH